MESTARSTSRSGQYRWWGCGRSTFISLATGASLNQGNSEKGTKSSSSPSSTQKPCFETFVTSTSKMLAPGGTDVLFVFPDQRFHRPELPVIQTVILR